MQVRHRVAPNYHFLPTNGKLFVILTLWRSPRVQIRFNMRRIRIGIADEGILSTTPFSATPTTAIQPGSGIVIIVVGIVIIIVVVRGNGTVGSVARVIVSVTAGMH